MCLLVMCKKTSIPIELPLLPLVLLLLLLPLALLLLLLLPLVLLLLLLLPFLLLRVLLRLLLSLPLQLLNRIIVEDPEVVLGRTKTSSAAIGQVVDWTFLFFAAAQHRNEGKTDRLNTEGWAPAVR